jgi:hypothetical protein
VNNNIVRILDNDVNSTIRHDGTLTQKVLFNLFQATNLGINGIGIKGSILDFAKPYSSWERGQNENANGLLRQYFPKAMELIDVTIKDVLPNIHSHTERIG